MRQSIKISLTKIIISFQSNMLLINLILGIVLVVWLLIIGLWVTLLLGLALLAISSIAFMFLIMGPSGLLMIYSDKLKEKGSMFSFGCTAALSIGLLNFGVLIWCFICYHLLTMNGSSRAIIPCLLWSYCVAIVPLNFTTVKSYTPGDSFMGSLTPTFANLAYIIMIAIMLLISESEIVALGSFLGIMYICAMVEFIIIYFIKEERE
jgi:hypothetical protein